MVYYICDLSILFCFYIILEFFFIYFVYGFHVNNGMGISLFNYFF